MLDTKYDEIINNTYQKFTNHAIGTNKAAQLLGISITSVKNLVDKQELIAWKTQGGHRRIDMESIRKYQKKLIKPLESSLKSKPLPSISLMVEDSLTVNLLNRTVNQWQEMIDFNIRKSISETYLSFSINVPDILIIQTNMPVAQQIAIILDLNNFIDSSEKYISVIFLTNVTDMTLRLQGKLNSAIQISNDTLSHEWLRAFINGVMASPEWRAPNPK
jgi:excisionase family DNA binding protein